MSTRVSQLYFLSLLALAPLLHAQTAYPLETLSVAGNEKIPADRIIAVSGLKVGQPVAKPDFDRARTTLLDTGAFNSVGYQYKPGAKGGYAAILEVSEVALLYKYRFEELNSSDAVLRDMLHKQEPFFTDALPATPDVLNRDSAALGKFLLGKSVIWELNSDLPGDPMIVFRPEGERSIIAGVDFTGNKTITLEDLRRSISSSAVGLAYSEPLFRRILDSTARALYEEHGRIRVAFPTLTLKPSTMSKGIVVTASIEEGPVYTLGTVEFAGVEPGKATEFRRLAGLHTGEPVNFTDVEAGLKPVRKNLHEDGYLHAQTTLERDIHDAEHVVNLRVNVMPGTRFNMGTLTIKGLNILTEPPIRKMWQIAQGKPYRESYPDTFIQHIEDDMVFDNLDKAGSEAVVHEDTGTVDVTLTFTTAPPKPRKP